MRTRSTRRDIGLRRKGDGWQAFIMVDGKFRSKQFPPKTPVEEMRAWRDRQLSGETEVSRLLTDPQKDELLELVRQVDEGPAAVACYAAVTAAQAALDAAQSALATVLREGLHAKLYPPPAASIAAPAPA